VSLGKNFHIQLDGKVFTFGLLFKLNHQLVTHFHILKHHFESLGKLKSTFLLELQDNCALDVLVDVALVEETFGERILVEAFKYILFF
jgi:hypothetical protein